MQSAIRDEETVSKSFTTNHTLEGALKYPPLTQCATFKSCMAPTQKHTRDFNTRVSPDKIMFNVKEVKRDEGLQLCFYQGEKHGGAGV